MRTFQTETEVSSGGVLILRDLPFAAGERVAVSINSPMAFAEMRNYAEKMAEDSHHFTKESDAHIAERLLRDTEW